MKQDICPITHNWCYEKCPHMNKMNGCRIIEKIKHTQSILLPFHQAYNLLKDMINDPK